MKLVLLITMIFGLVNADFVRKNRINIVKDTTLNLEWQDDKVVKDLNLKDAKRYCSNLSLRGSGWRLPSQKELRTIVDKTNFYPSIATPFVHTSMRDSNSMYWTSTKYEFNKDAAWLVGFWGGGDHYSSINYKANVRCVRDAE